MEDMAFTGGSTKNLPEGWTQTKEKLLEQEPESEDSGRMETVVTPRSIEELEKILKLRWERSNYSLVLGKMTLSMRWPREKMMIKQSLWE